MIFKRRIHDQILEHLTPGKVVRIYGPRRSGKSTLISQIISELNYDTMIIQGDERRYDRFFEEQSISAMKELVGNKQLLVIDEAQMIPDIGVGLKLLVDHVPTLRILVTGSSTLGLGQKIGEPLVGRSWTFHLNSLSYQEIYDHDSSLLIDEKDLERTLIYGSYPELFKLTGEQSKQSYLLDLKDNYLYKDIAELYIIEKPRMLGQLLQLLALQLGSEVSLTELGQQIGIDPKTVDKYLRLLEESFIIFRLGGFRRNLRNEVTKFGKYYFWDNGVRNALIGSFGPVESRNDIGGLWENYLISERRKISVQPGSYRFDYFWRTDSGSEIDYIETAGGKITAWEMKWGRSKKNAPPSFSFAYPEAKYCIVDRSNYHSFITN
jgi:uncharacterized protein